MRDFTYERKLGLCGCQGNNSSKDTRSAGTSKVHIMEQANGASHVYPGGHCDAGGVEIVGLLLWKRPHRCRCGRAAVVDIRDGNPLGDLVACAHFEP